MRSDNVENVDLSEVKNVGVISLEAKTDSEKKDASLDFEEALKLTGIGKYNYLLVFVTIYSLVAGSMEMFSVGVLVPSSQCDLEMDIHIKGLIGSVPMLGVIGGAHLWGYLADTKGRKYTLLITTAGTFVMALVSSFANHWIFMVVAKLGSSFCASGTNAVIYALLGESSPESHRSKYLLYASTGIMLSQAYMSALSYPILLLEFSYDLPLLGIKYRPWRLLAQALALANLINFVLLYYCTYESAKFFFSNGNHDAGLDVLAKIRQRNTSADASTYEATQVTLNEDRNTARNQNIFQSMWNQTKPMFYRQHIKNTFLVSYVCIVAYCISPPFVMWLPQIFNSYTEITDSSTTFCEMVKHMDKSGTTSNLTMVTTGCKDKIEDFTFLALTIFGCFAGGVSALSVVIIKFTGKKNFFIGIHIVCTVLAIISNKVPASIGLFIFCSSLMNVVCMGLSTIYAVELFPTYMRAMAVCLTMMMGRGVSFIIINLHGTQLVNNCNNLLYYIAAFIVSGALVGFLLPADKKPQDNNTGKEHNNGSA